MLWHQAHVGGVALSVLYTWMWSTVPDAAACLTAPATLATIKYISGHIIIYRQVRGGSLVEHIQEWVGFDIVKLLFVPPVIKCCILPTPMSTDN